MLQTERLLLRLPTADDASAFLAFYERNQVHLQPWEPTRQAHFYTLASQAKSIESAIRAAETEEARLFLLMDRANGDELLGFIHLNSVIRGVFQSGRLGYKLDSQAQGLGLMGEALQAVITYAFSEMNLHRLEANYMVQNTRSGAVLRKLGFQQVGQEDNYLFLNGAWRDHVLTVKKNHDWRPKEPKPRVHPSGPG